ncbi:MAG: hypothetical protein U0269_06410 [Polyangiales bacterium]
MSTSVLDQLQQRARRAPASIRRAVTQCTPWMLVNMRAMAAPKRWLTCGIGASEGVARATAAWLRNEANIPANFRAFSEWLVDGSRGDRPDESHELGVIVFSQGLCPNARVALSRAPQTATRVLVTAAIESEAAQQAQSMGWLILPHEPADEGSLLVRLEGPLCAMAVGRALAESLAMSKGSTRLSRASLDAATSFERGFEQGQTLGAQQSTDSLDAVCAMLVSGRSLATHSGLPWTWMESTLSAPIALWDALGFAHGPMQAIYERRATIVSFERANEGENALFDRVGAVLDPERHTLVRVRAETDDESAVFAHFGALWGMLTSQLARRPRDLRNWPGKGRDRALYELGG